MAVLRDVLMPGLHSDYESTLATLEQQNKVLCQLLERNNQELAEHLQQNPESAAAFLATASFDNDPS